MAIAGCAKNRQKVSSAREKRRVNVVVIGYGALTL
jgi:hypothetical protein